MAHPQPYYQNGVPPQDVLQRQRQQQQHQQQQYQQQDQSDNLQTDEPHLRTRPFSLDEALPYTPFTSVFPFDSDILSNPTIGVGSFAPSLANLVPRDDYNALNYEAGNATQSKRLEGSLEYVQNLLRPEKITNFKFKTAPKVAVAPHNSVKNLTDGISPFAKLVYDNTSILFGHPSSGSSTGSPANGASMAGMGSRKSPKQRKPEISKVVKHNPVSTNTQAVAHNKSRIEVHIPSQKQREAASAVLTSQSVQAVTRPIAQPQPQTVSLADLVVKPQVSPVPVPKIEQGLVITPVPVIPQAPKVPVPPPDPPSIPKTEKETTPQISSIPPPRDSLSSAPSSQRQAELRIELPKATFNREEFAVVPDSPDAPADLSSRRGHDAIEDPLTTDLNQRERANLLFAELRRCLQEIFVAEDQLSSQQVYSSPFVYITANQELTMTSSAHDKAQRLLKRAIDIGCFGQVPCDSLVRLQNLSEGSLKYADSLEFKINEEWGETDVSLWVQQIPDIDRGLKAARTALRVMCGGREEKQIYSEDLIQLSLDVFRNVMEGIIVPIAEIRSTGPTATLFRCLTAHKKTIMALFASSQKLFALMSDLIASIDLSETVVNTLEFLSSRLMFVENAYTEKDSVVGVSKFDGLRLVAMHMLSQIFLMNPAQREGILSEILTSLEKLPVGKQKARQFRLSGGGSIQPISALIMRLIQASAGKVDDSKDEFRSQIMQSIQDNTVSSSSQAPKRRYNIRTEDHAAIEHEVAIQELRDLSSKLFDGACRYAHYVVNFIVKRALKSTKTGDTPYRNLLDLFVEDFTTCLDSPDWPAAELLLRLTMILMFKQLDGEKNAAPARNMALELLGVMAASISKLRSHVRKTASSFEGTDSDELGRWLADLSLTVLEGYGSLDKAVKWDGPYRIVVEFLQDRLNEDEHLYSAISYIVTDWGSQITAGYDTIQDDDYEDRHAEFGRTAYRLRNMIEDSKWLSREWRFKSVAANHARLSHAILLLRSNFCSAFKSILNLLMGSMTTDQATVRSRSLKSVNQVLETDPTILDGDSAFVDLILQCSSDSSPQVRDSALGLIGKCISMRPRLEERMTPTVIQRFIDSGVGVRKRAMKLAKDIYLGNENKAVRSTIANGLLHRMQDPDEGVRELARQMIEEIWISPFYKEDDSISFKQSLTDHVALMVQTAKQGNTALILDKVFQTILAPESKLSEANTRVCTKLVANMFDLVDNPESDDPSVPSGKDALQVLMIFAKADPKLFSFEQISLLKPHIESVGKSEDLAVSRAVVVIYRRVLPQVSSVHSQFLLDIQGSLMPATAKITRTLLDDVIACIWIISGLLHNTARVARLISSSLAGIQKIRAILAKGLDQRATRQFDRYSLIVGMGGKHCQLDSHVSDFKEKFPNWKGDSVSKLMVDVICPFAQSSQSVDIRRPALDAIGLICQSNPRNFVTENVIAVFEQVFKEQTVVLESMILRSFREFLFTEEQRSNQSNTSTAKEKKDLKVMGSTSFDDVASATTQRFLTAITRIALATHDDHAFLAVEILASINRQGLVHPKETGVTLITLETCPVTRISELAYYEHKALHEKYESVLEREYAKAVQSAFQYQRDVVGDCRGATEAPFTSKLHLLIEMLKISKAKNRAKFFEKMVGQLEFEPSTLDTTQQLPSHVAYSRFLLENIAFFEYVSVGDLQTVVSALEKLVTGTGAAIAQTMESEIFQVRMDQDTSTQPIAEGETSPAALVVPSSINTQRFRQLTASSMIISAVWEVRTFLRRLYGLTSIRREVKVKGQPKDLTKAPVKIQGVTGDKFWEDMSFIMTALETPERMIQQCRTFVDLLNVDSEVKIGEEDDDEDLDAEGEAQSPEADEEDDEATPDARGRKRKAANTPGGRKKRARSSSRPRGRGRPRKNQSTGVSIEDDDF